MKVRYFDTHAHITDHRFNSDRRELLEVKLPQAGVTLVTDIACDLRTAESTVALINKYDYIYGTVGMHPHSVSAMNNALASKLVKLLEHDKMVAVGEIGLDYHYDFSPRNVQKQWFDEQLCIAEQYSMPVVLHIREAFGDCMDILRSHKASLVKNGGIMHCFSGSPEIAFECIALGLIIGIGGSVTFNNARRLLEVAAETPLDSFVLETDCPYMTPTPFRGERNDPSYLNLIAMKVAELRGATTANIAEAAYKNGCRVYRIDDM